MVAISQSSVGRKNVLAFVVHNLFQNKYALMVLNTLALIFLFSRNNNEINEYYDYGVNSLNEVGGSLRAVAETLGSSPAAAAAGNSCAAMEGSTVAMVEPNDPDLHKTATVMAMATGYNIRDYKRFVGSLRKTGFEGNIILVVAPDIKPREEEYLRSKKVTMHKVKYTDCSHPVKKDIDRDRADGHTKELLTCVDPYPSLKHRWARFPLLRDLLLECGGDDHPEVRCGGPVLITDMRDALFQRNPFGPDAPKVHGLQVFEEHYTIRTTHWLVDWPVNDCKGVRFDEPMLCSGTTIGTRRAMLDYLEIFHGEMNTWMASEKCCCFETNGDDQSMHNYLYYSGMLNGVTGGVTAVRNRDGLVHTVGALGSLIFNTHVREKKILRKAQNHPSPNDAHHEKFDISNEEDAGNTRNWLGLHYGLTDRDGYFVQYDGTRSFVIHQYDRFGFKYDEWLSANAMDIYEP